MIPMLKAVSNLLSFEKPAFVDYFLYCGLLDVYYRLAQQFNWNEAVISEICFGICNIIVSTSFDHQ